MSVLFVGIHCATAVGRPIYVDANAPPGGDGASWATAYRYLQDALADADSYPDPNDIWVAAGVYTPDTSSAEPNGAGDRTATFQLISGVGLYGGFPSGGDPNWNDRDPNVHETILSGDLDGNDVDVNDPCDLLTEPTRGENSYHVLIANRTGPNVILDGFTIAAGNTNGSSSPDFHGGGMHNSWCSPTVTNCAFRGNSATSGGGMYNRDYSNPTLSNCTFRGNWATNGGGMYSNDDSSPTLTDCTFSGNSADYGGGLRNGSGILTLTNCTFTSNRAKKRGGGAGFSYGRQVLENCTFSGNSADYGGGMYNSDYSGLTLTDCSIIGNSAGQTGGGIYNGSHVDPTLTNCAFRGNSATNGGGMYNWSSSPTVTNCTFSGNAANYSGGGIYSANSSPQVSYSAFKGNSANAGGGMYCGGASNPAVTGCTFTGNWADYGGGMCNQPGSATVINSTFSGNSADYGGSMYNGSHSSSTVSNCILWGNSASSGGNEIYNDTGTPVISYCDIAACLPGGVWDANLGSDGGGNIDADPCFADPCDEDYRLKSEGGRWDPCSESWVLDGATSPCIDTGDPHTSFSAELSPHGCRVNMGAYGDTEQASKSPVMASVCCESYECSGQPFGDATCDGNVNLADLFALKAHYGTSAPWVDNQCCADFSHDGNVNLDDLFTLKAGFATSGYSPSTGNQNCFSCERPGGDTTPPAPAPYLITVEANSPNSIAMAASEAYHECGVQYYFECIAGGGHDSGWRDEPYYTDVNLVFGTEYCYRVKARDKSPNQNETTWSEPACAYTGALCETAPTPDPMQWDETLDANGFDGWPREVWLGPDPFLGWYVTMRADPNTTHDCGTWAFYFECVDDSRYDSDWISFPAGPPYAYTVHVGLSGLQFGFRVKARDACCWNQTGWSPIGTAAAP
jgi:parallel beta-helix repeat protein